MTTSVDRLLQLEKDIVSHGKPKPYNGTMPFALAPDGKLLAAYDNGIVNAVVELDPQKEASTELARHVSRLKDSAEYKVLLTSLSEQEFAEYLQRAKA